MRFNCLDDWLHWQESLNPAEIDLGLDRVSLVLTQAGLATSFNCPLITVAGTNGKGSVVAMLEAIALAAGLTVCSYTSPHIFKYNERIKINGRAVDDDTLCEAFERIDQARGDIALTYFEFGTLAAIDVFFRAEPDLVILEVGLGGRLDAVNVMDADASVLTSVAIDHIDWLGDDRESIGYEKAGIFRAEKPVICGEREAPESVLRQANRLQCEFIQAGRDYHVINEDINIDANVQTHHGHWTLKNRYGEFSGLPRPSLVGEFQKSNAATAITALQTLQAKGLLFSASALDKNDPLMRAVPAALANIRLPGRFQLIHSKPQVYVDVAHNLQAAQALASQLKSEEFSGQSGNTNHTWAIVAMLSDKDIKGVLSSVSTEIDFWCFSGLEKTARGASVQHMLKNIPASILPQAKAKMDAESAAELQDKLMANQCTILSATVLLAKTVTDACRLVLSKADKKDRIVIFGSFYTVTEAMHFFTGLSDDAVELRN
jgi:dihydrofolate synthase/folylpolyglutamate synthase